MRDPIRNYKQTIAGHDSDSDESEPLLSSSSSSFSSTTFGSTFDASRLPSDTEDDNVKNSPILNTSVVYPLSPTSARRKFECKLIFGNQFGPSIVDMYNAEELLFEKTRGYSAIPDLIQSDHMSLQTGPAAVKAPSSSEVTFEGFVEYKEPKKHTHNSVVTIFAIWNTTMGSSLLAMSWGIQMSGLFPGIAINILVAALCLYTCHLLLNVNDKHGMAGQDIEVSHLCQDLLGKWAEVLARVFSVVVLLGADVVYIILISNFLYNSVYFFYGLFTDPAVLSDANATVLCPKDYLLNTTPLPELSSKSTVHESMFEMLWDLHSTVPIVLAVIMFCVLNFKSPTFFTKFNSLGTISVIYLLVFVAVKGYGWGINLTNITEEFYIKPTFTALSGMLSLSYFIHNIIISIMKNNRHQEHNGRDLSIAFGLVTFTYLFIGIVFYVTFPLAKACIEDNILNNFSKTDILTIIARILLMFQLFTVFPLISYMLRKDIFSNLNGIFTNHGFGEFTYCRVMLLNGVLLVVCVLFACFLPKIGTLIRYTGALSGLVYIFMLPNLLKVASLKKEGELTTSKAVWHFVIILAGALNLLSQFFIAE